MSFFEELKRRNVFRVGIAYLIGAWLLARQLRDFGGADVHPRQGVNRALAAYNAGPGRARAWLAGTRPLPSETLRYQATVGALRTRLTD